MTATQPGENDAMGEDTGGVEGRGVLISGGTTGIGRALAVLLARHGARVMIFGRDEAALQDALSGIAAAGGTAEGVVADVADPADIARVFAETDQALGRLDVLINNAALGAGSVTQGSYEDWRYVVDTNLLGYLALAHEAVERMREHGGHVVNIGSMSADVREEGSSLYVATKGAIQAFSEALRKEVNPLGVKVSLIEPGSTGTDMQPVSPQDQARKEDAGEMLKAEDVAAAVLYVLSQPPRCDVVSLQLRPHLQPI